MGFRRLYSPDHSSVFFCALTYIFYKIAFHFNFKRNVNKVMFDMFEFRTLVLLKIRLFWDVTPCQLVNGYRFQSAK